MKREWYNYGPLDRWISATDLRDHLPASVRTRLLSDPVLSSGICVDAGDHVLVAELDRLLRVGRKNTVVRWLQAEADRASIAEYGYYCINPICIDPVLPSPLPRDLVEARTPEQYAQSLLSHCSNLRVKGIRELATALTDPYERVLLLTSEVASLFKAADVKGVHYSPLTGELSILQVLCRVPCRADHIVAPDYEEKTQSVVGPYLFGLRYEVTDVGSEDLQLIDRIEVGPKVYRYRMPWLVASRRFIELCIKNKVTGIRSPCVLFKDGMVPLLVGRGRITSSLYG